MFICTCVCAHSWRDCSFKGQTASEGKPICCLIMKAPEKDRKPLLNGLRKVLSITGCQPVAFWGARIKRAIAKNTGNQHKQRSLSDFWSQGNVCPKMWLYPSWPGVTYPRCVLCELKAELGWESQVRTWWPSTCFSYKHLAFGSGKETKRNLWLMANSLNFQNCSVLHCTETAVHAYGADSKALLVFLQTTAVTIDTPSITTPRFSIGACQDPMSANQLGPPAILGIIYIQLALIVPHIR